MKLTNHPEYSTYSRDQETAQRCRQGIAAWEASDESIVVKTCSLCWTFESMQEFVHSLSHLFQEYNRVLWERFPYCVQCDGKCCVPGAPNVRPFDTIALALLGYSQPTLPGEVEATARDCIYHTANGCVWPKEWRPVKCWSFFCALDERYTIISEELKEVVLNLLPDPLRRYEAVWGDQLAAYLVDPVDFAGTIHKALLDVFVAPFDDRYSIITKEPSCGGPEDVGGQEDLDVATNVLTFIMEVAEQVRGSPPLAPKGSEVPPEQLLADLESLEWIVMGLPEYGPKLLDELYQRYAPAAALSEGKHAAIWHHMCYHILYLRNNWEQLVQSR